MFVIPSGDYRGFKADGPGLFGVPELDINCRCYLVTDVKQKEKQVKEIEKQKIPALTYIQQSAKDFYNNHKKEKSEWLSVYKNGEILWETTDDESTSVKWPRGAQTKDTDAIHNHPVSGIPAPSPADVHVGMVKDVRSNTTITAGGEYWTINRPEDGWDPIILSKENVKKIYAEEVALSRLSNRAGDLLALIKNKRLTEAEANVAFSRYITRNALRTLGLKFVYGKVSV